MERQTDCVLEKISILLQLHKIGQMLTDVRTKPSRQFQIKFLSWTLGE